MEVYNKNKYPDKEEMNRLAKIIDVKPIKVLWWFSHRRRAEAKQLGNVGTPLKVGRPLKSSKVSPTSPDAAPEDGPTTKDKPKPKNPMFDWPFANAAKRTCLKCDDFKGKRFALIRHIKEAHGGIKTKFCKGCSVIFKTRHLKLHTCEEFVKREEELKKEMLEAKKAKKLAAKADKTTPVIPEIHQAMDYKLKTPTKSDLKKPVVFYSRRYSSLLKEFSPKKVGKPGNDHLSELLQKTSALRNGRLDLNYVTPSQLKAVEQFMLGDSTYRVLIFFSKLLLGNF